MIKMKKQEKVLRLLAIIVLLVFVSSACSTISQKNEDSATVDKGQGYTPVYYDFGDVLVPSEMKVLKKGSFVFTAPGFSAGVLSLRGRVEINSLIKFFNVNMAKDNWTLVSSFKSQRTIMLFNKENRWCVINITEEDYYTYTEIWVSPTSGGVESGLLK